MAGCKAASGTTFTCEDLLKVGGVFPTFYVGYLSELATLFSLTQSSDISTISFKAYGGLRRFEGNKFAHQFSHELAVGAGGTKSYTQTFEAHVIADSTPDDVVLQNLALGTDIFVIAQDNNQVFYILGAGNGLSASAATRATGQTGDSDTSDIVTLTGSEKTKPLRFMLAGGASATVTYLEARVI